MSAVVRQLRCQEVVGVVATTDAEATADLVLDIAIKSAVEFLGRRAGTEHYRITRAELLLERAGASADRILGRTTR